jgi:hypothetical protein
VSLTEDSTFTALAALRYSSLFGRRELFQLPPTRAGERDDDVAAELRTRLLFSSDLGYRELLQRLERGARIRTEPAAAKTPATTDERRVVLFVVKPSGRLLVGAADGRLTPSPGDKVITLTGG